MVDVSKIQSNAAIQGAYGSSQKLKGAQDAATGEASQSFGDMLRDAAEQSVQAVRQGDEVATSGLTGDASIQQVVEATMSMESTVRVSVAVRDKIVEAYQEIMRMPI